MTRPLDAATERLLHTVDLLPDDAFGAPSHCAGWSRAHVVAHLALNAEGLGGVLRGFRDGAPTTMYASDHARDGDIDELARATPGELRARLRTACASFAEVVDVAGGLEPGLTFERTPGGRTMPAGAVPGLRHSEVEIHHADLDAGYAATDWPAAFAVEVLEASAARYDGPGLHLAATDRPDGPDRWTFGTPGPEAVTVTGPVGALAWWSTGRDAGSLLSTTNGSLPTLEGR